MGTLVNYTLDDQGVGIIKFNRPKELNALSGPLLEEICALLTEIESDNRVRVIILTGEGRAFCAGGDLQEMQRGFEGVARNYRHMEKINRYTMLLAELGKPVIAAVNGAATGAGMNTALAADIVIASETAVFSEIFGNVGLVPDVGGAYLLPRIVGRARAKELIFSARMVDAKEALKIGLISQIVPLEELENEAYKLAKKIAKGPAFAFALAKKMINQSFETDLTTLLRMEAMAQALAANSREHQEGVSAFFEKRKPEFKES